jgi:hypothetical protein
VVVGCHCGGVLAMEIGTECEKYGVSIRRAGGVMCYDCIMTPAQCRAARALINNSQDQLADLAAVSVTTLRTFERGATVPVTNNMTAIRAALERAGVEFTPENGGGAGVRLRKFG